MLRTLLLSGEQHVITLDPRPLPEVDLDLAADFGARIDAIVSANIADLHEHATHIRAVICVAGATSVDAGLEAPSLVYKQNLAIALGLAEFLHKTEIPAVYVSSDEVLGESFVPLTAQSQLRPTQPYAASKACAETILHNYRDVYGIKLATLRSCNLVGPGQSPPKLLPVAVEALLSRSPVPIHGSGNQHREWMHVSDICEAVLYLIRASFPPAVFQATTAESMSIIEAVRLIAESLNVTPMTVNVSDRLVQDASYRMNPASLNELGWQPHLSGANAIMQAAHELAGGLNALGRGACTQPMA
jgi:dTDP-glucose 4,6-dehydratase